MTFTLPVIWSSGGVTHTGRLDLLEERLALSSRDETVSVAFEAVAGFAIERGPGQRLRGLAALRISLSGGDVLRIASMGGAGSLHELAALLGGRQPALNGS
jgi:hypothetical protein